MFWKTKKTSEKEPKSNPEKTDKTVNRVFGVVAFTTFMILASCGIMFYNTCMAPLSHKECDHLWMELRDSIYADMGIIDSISATQMPSNNIRGKDIPAQTKETDSCKFIFTQYDIENLKKTQKILIARQDRMADDLRQETNNMINKVNGWLSFWMGIMAILGVFIPIALQFKLYRETRDSDQSLKKQHEEDRIRIEDLMRQSQADIKGEYVKLGVYIKREHKDYFCKIKRELDSAKLFANIRNFQNIADSPSISMNEARYTLLRKNLDNIVKYTQSFIKDYLNRQEGHDNYELSVLLVEVTEVLTTLRRLYPRRSRRLQVLTEESYHIIKEINATRLDIKSIKVALESYSESLSALYSFAI